MSHGLLLRNLRCVRCYMSDIRYVTYPPKDSDLLCDWTRELRCEPDCGTNEAVTDVKRLTISTIASTIANPLVMS